MFYYEHSYDHSYRWVQPPVGPRYIIIYYFVRGPAGTLHVPDIGPGERADIMDEKKALLCSTSITRSECVSIPEVSSSEATTNIILDD